MSKILLRLVFVSVIGLAVACGGEGEPPPTASPRPSVNGTSAAPLTSTPVTAATETPLTTAQPAALQEVAAVSEAGLYLVEVSTGRLWRLEGSAAWSPDGRSLARWSCCLGGGGLDVIEVPGGASLRVFDGDVNAAVWSPDGAQIAFSRWGNGPEGVYVVNRDGGELRELSTKGTHVIEWSGTGKRLAFFRDEHVYLLDVDSGQTVDIPDVVDFSFAWSPQGTEVAFANDSGLHVYDAKEGALRQIADGPSDGFVLWSPDGSRIIFPFGPQVPFAHNPEVGIQAPYVVGAQGDTEPTPLPVASTISWSPDGSRIAYLEFGCVTGAWDIYTVAPDGGSPRPVTRTPETVKEGPYWSPTGTAIAYSTFGQIILLDVESGVAQTLVSSDPTAGGDMHLHGSPWSPDGRYIQFTAGTAHGICD